MVYGRFAAAKRSFPRQDDGKNGGCRGRISFDTAYGRLRMRDGRSEVRGNPMAECIDPGGSPE
jgi:hypothetical protein